MTVADPNYCYPLHLFCHPLDWWSSAASWAQAIMSAAAIWFSGHFVLKQRRVAIAERTGIVAAIAAQVCDEAVRWRERVSAGVDGTAAAAWDFGDLERLASALIEVPLHELPHEAMVKPVALIQQDSTALIARLADIRRRAINLSPITQGDDTACGTLAAAIMDARHFLLDISAWHSARRWNMRKDRR